MVSGQSPGLPGVPGVSITCHWRAPCRSPSPPPSEGTGRWTHHHDVARPVLDGAKEPQDDHDDVDEGGQDGRPLVAQEVKQLPLQGGDLGQEGM